MANEKTNGLNYEAEYERLDAICKKQYMELKDYEEKFQYIEQENRELKARLDMVYLIFGGVNRG